MKLELGPVARRLLRIVQTLWPAAAVLLAVGWAFLTWPDHVKKLISDAGLGDLAQACATLIALAAAAYAYRALRENKRISILNKRADVILHCAERYDDLYRDRYSLKKANDADGSTMFYNRYWGLKSDQIDYYLAGWIDPDTLRSWLYSTYLNIKSDIGLCITIQESWEKVREYHLDVNPYFAQITDALFFAAKNSVGRKADIAVINDIMQQLETGTTWAREMIQRKYGVKEYIFRLRKNRRIIEQGRLKRATNKGSNAV